MKIALQQYVLSDKYERYNFGDEIFVDKIEYDETWDFISRICKAADPLLLLIRLGDVKDRDSFQT